MRCCNRRLIWLLACWAALSGDGARAESAPSFHPSLAAAFEAAAEDQSPILAVFGAEWCPTCHILRRATLDSPEFQLRGGALRGVHVDIEADAGLARSFGVGGIPVLVLLSSDGKVVARHEGLLGVEEFMEWLRAGRERIALGQWEGTAPAGELVELVARGAAGGLGAEELSRLVGLLAEPDPADRAAAGRLILQQRERAMEPLIAAVGDRYLGVRIAAVELIQRLAPGAPVADPWENGEGLEAMAGALREWWEQTGTLPPEPAGFSGGAPADSAVRLALEALRGEDPVRRTEAMSALVRYGAGVLPAVRQAIRQQERSGDHRAVALLEDVRWSVLISDILERRAGRVRTALARGSSLERQAAAARLAKGGREAIPALAELANDSDSLVVESAVRALSEVGGADVIPAMAALLGAADSNLRITAAQALGKTRSGEAAGPLIGALGDSNEVVATTVLAALEEIYSREHSRARAPAEVAAALRRPLADSRWRVRAMAIEVAGKLRLQELAPEVKASLSDADGFVVRQALRALSMFGAEPDAGELAALGRRLPGLRRDVVEMILDSGVEDAAATVLDLYRESGADEKAAILGVLADQETDSDEEGWEPLLREAAGDANSRIRRAAAGAIARRASPSTAGLVTFLLSSEDPEVRGMAAEGALRMLTGKKASRYPDYMEGFVDDDEDADEEGGEAPGGLVEAHAGEWRAALLKDSGAGRNPTVDMVIYLCGDGTSDLSRLAGGLEEIDSAGVARLVELGAVEAVLKKLPWPEGREVLDRLTGHPVLFAHAAASGSRGASREVAEYLLEPARFCAAVEGATGGELQQGISVLLGGAGRWSLLSADDASARIAEMLLASETGAWRAAAVYSLGWKRRAEDDAVFDRMLEDGDPWVRVAAIQSIARRGGERSLLERRLERMFDDTFGEVRQVAAVALLEPEVIGAADLEPVISMFRYGGIRSGRYDYSSGGEDRPLSALAHRPVFLEKARELMRSAPEQSEAAVMGLLLAQFGDASGVDRVIQLWESHGRRSSGGALAAVALSGDGRYVPFLREVAGGMESEWELRDVLKAARGMSGPEARQLRLDVNRMMREKREE